MKRKDKATRKKASPPPWEHRFLARWAFAVPFVFAFVLYGNTIAHDYALDDGIITRQNEFVQMGVAGIPKIFAKGFLFGFNRTNDQSYRPLTLANMAVEKELLARRCFTFCSWPSRSFNREGRVGSPLEFSFISQHCRCP